LVGRIITVKPPRSPKIAQYAIVAVRWRWRIGSGSSSAELARASASAAKIVSASVGTSLNTSAE
jgi:hypothetical protein